MNYQPYIDAIANLTDEELASEISQMNDTFFSCYGLIDKKVSCAIIKRMQWLVNEALHRGHPTCPKISDELNNLIL